MGVGVTMVLDATISIGKVSYHQTAASESVLSLDSLGDQLSAAAETATAIYSPPAAANLTPLVFMQYDNDGQQHRWGWVYDSKAQTLTKCTKFNPGGNDYDLTCSGVSSTISLTSFTSTAIDAATLSTNLGLPAQEDVSTEMDSPARDPNGIVVASNTVRQISFALGTGARTVNLLQGARPLSVSVIEHENQSPALGQLTGPTSVNLQLGVNPSTTATYTQTNYGQYLPYLGSNGGWTDTTCVGSGGATVVLSGYSGDTATYTITASRMGLCSFDVGASNAQFPVTVNVGAAPTPPPPTPSPTPVPTPTAIVTATPTSAPTPTPPDPSPLPPLPSPTAKVNLCSGNYGTPSFTEPATYDSPTIASLYAEVSQPGFAGANGGTNSPGGNARTPNGNTVYGFFDHFPSEPNQPEKGAILISENTDCSVTFMMASISQDNNNNGMGSGEQVYAAVWQMPSPFYSVDTSSYGGGMEDQILCYEELGNEPDGVLLSLGVNTGNFPGAQAACNLTENGNAADDPIAHTSLAFTNPYEDRVLVATPKGTYANTYVARWVLNPDDRLTILPIPLVGHYLKNSSGQTYDYWEEGAAWYGTGLSSSSGLVLTEK
jgi:hypothetical protein